MKLNEEGRMSLSRNVDEERLLTESEAALILGVHQDAVKVWCDEGILRSYAKDGRARRAVSEDSVLDLLFPVAGAHQLSAFRMPQG
jgi:hypothetical protein